MMCFMAARRAACSSSVMEGRRTEEVRDAPWLRRRRDCKDGRRGRCGAGASNKDCSSGGGAAAAAAAASGARWTGFSSERDVVSMDLLLLF